MGIYKSTQPDLIYHSSVQMSFLGSLARLIEALHQLMPSLGLAIFFHPNN